MEDGGWSMEKDSTILYLLSSIFHLPSSILISNWSPRRDLNSHETHTAGIALPLSYAGSFKLPAGLEPA